MKKIRIIIALVTVLFCASFEYMRMSKNKVGIEQFVSTRVQPNEQKEIHRYIITGGPGVGKTTIANQLKKIKGIAAIDEAATRIIQSELAAGVSRPWEQAGFDDKIVSMQKDDRRQAASMNVDSLFFDRTSIDSLSYCIHHDLTPTPAVIAATEEVISYYNPQVFLVENFGQCQQTEVRCETLEESTKIEQLLEKNYRALGFNVFRVKPGTVEQRVEAILQAIE